MKRAIFFLSIVGCFVYASERKELAFDDIRKFAEEQGKQGNDDLYMEIGLNCIANSIAEEMGKKFAALPTPEARAEFLKRYNH